ncbi:hypothetical protein [Nostoc sp. C057]|nr:hypothetical protein [Nostoc sp. C057]
MEKPQSLNDDSAVARPEKLEQDDSSSRKRVNTCGDEIINTFVWANPKS